MLRLLSSRVILNITQQTSKRLVISSARTLCANAPKLQKEE